MDLIGCFFVKVANVKLSENMRLLYRLKPKIDNTFVNADTVFRNS